MRAPCGPRVWAGPIVYLIALLGIWLLANESAWPWAVLVLVGCAMLAVALWRRQNWISAFPSDATARTRANRLFYLFGVTIAMLLVLCGGPSLCRSAKWDVRARRYLMDRRHSLAALLCFLRLTFITGCFQRTTPSALLANVGNSASGRAVRPGVAQSSLEPEKFPRQRLSGRNHNRHRRHSELSKSNNSAVGL